MLSNEALEAAAVAVENWPEEYNMGNYMWARADGMFESAPCGWSMPNVSVPDNVQL